MIRATLLFLLILLSTAACDSSEGQAATPQATAVSRPTDTPRQRTPFADPLLPVTLSSEIGNGSAHGAIVWSPDSSRFVMGLQSGAWLFDRLTDLSASVGRLDGPIRVSRIAFSPDGRYFASASGYAVHPAPEIGLYDAATGALLHTIRVPDDPDTPAVMDIVFSDTALFALTDGGNVFQFSIETGALLGDFDTEFLLPQFLAISPDGTSLAHGSRWSNDNPDIPDQPAAHLIDIETGAVTGLNGQQERIMIMAFLRDGRLATISADDILTIWDPSADEASEPVSSVPLAGSVFEALVLDDGTLASVRPFAAAIDLETGALEPYTVDGNLSPDGAHAVHRFSAPGEDTAVSVRDVASTEVISSLPFTSFTLTWLESPAPSIVAGNFPGGSDIDHFNLDTRQVGAVAAAPGPDGELFGTVAHSPDGRFIAGAVSRLFNGGGDISVFDVASGELVHTLSGHLEPPSMLAFSLDGTRLISRGNTEADHTVRVWDTDSGAALAVLRNDDLNMSAAALSPDGATVVTSESDIPANSHALRIRDVSTGELRGEIALNLLTSHAAFSPDGRVLVLAGGTTARFAGVQFFDGQTFEPLSPIYQIGSALVIDIAFSDDGERLLASDSAGDLLVWDVDSRQVIAAIASGGLVYHTFDFVHGSSTHIVTADQTGIMKIWEIGGDGA